MKNSIPVLILTLFFNIYVSAQPSEVLTLQVPGRNQYASIKEKGISVLPSGRFVRPAGEMIRITHDPFGMAISPDGKKAVTLHNGVFTIIDLLSLSNIRVPSYDNTIKSPLSNGSFLGVTFAADNRTIYLSGGDNGAVIKYDIEKMNTLDSISLNGTVGGTRFDDSFTSDLVLNESRNELLVLDRGNFRLVRHGTLAALPRQGRAALAFGRHKPSRLLIDSKQVTRSGR